MEEEMEELNRPNAEKDKSGAEWAEETSATPQRALSCGDAQSNTFPPDPTSKRLAESDFEKRYLGLFGAASDGCFGKGWTPVGAAKKKTGGP